MRLRGIKNHGTVVLHHHYRKASGHQWNPNWEQDDSFRWVASSGSSHGVMVISSGTQQKEQKSSAEFCGFTFIILSQIICHDYITLYVYIYIHTTYTYIIIYIYIYIISFWDVIFWVLLGWFHGTNPTLCLCCAPRNPCPAAKVTAIAPAPQRRKITYSWNREGTRCEFCKPAWIQEVVMVMVDNGW